MSLRKYLSSTRWIARLPLVWLIVATTPSAGAAGFIHPGAEITDPAVRECLERTLPEQSFSQQIRFTTFDHGEQISESAANLYWRRFEDGGSRALVRLTDPPRKAGLALLANERSDNTLQQDVTVYLPELRVVRRISGSALSGSMFGTNFSYNDFVQLQGMLRQRSMRRLDDATVHERPAYTIETIPEYEESEYSRIVTYIDQAWCVAVQIQFYGTDNALAKELVVDPASVVEVSGRWVPHALVLEDFAHEARTELVVEKVEINPELNPNLFTAAELRRGK